MDMTNPPTEESVTGQPPADAAASGVVPPVPPSEELPPKPPRPKLNPGFFILGLLTPFVVSLGLGFAINWLDTAFKGVPAALGITIPGIAALLFFLFLYLAMRGRTTGNNRLRSYGSGGMWSYITIPLLALLLFGTCLINPSMWG